MYFRAYAMQYILIYLVLLKNEINYMLFLCQFFKNVKHFEWKDFYIRFHIEQNT